MFSADMIDRKEAIQQGLQGPYVVIQNALQNDIAEQLYSELLDASSWEKVRVAHGDFRSCRDNIPLDHNDAPPALKEFYSQLINKENREWFSSICGKHCESFSGAATDFKLGDHIAEHNDRFVYDEPGKPRYARTLTFNYYLSKKWEEEWGGNFVWKHPFAKIVPSFNTLVLFSLTPSSHHWVEPVVVNPKFRRISITGWYIGEVQKKKLSLGL